MNAEAVALSGAYVLGLRGMRARGLRWPAGRSVAFAAGVSSLGWATCGGVGRYAHLLLWAYTVQVVLLLLVAPALIALGRPLVLAVDALPTDSAKRVLNAICGRPVRAITSPLLGPLVVPIVLAGVYFTPVLRVTLQNGWAFGALHIGLLAVGLAIAIGLVGDGVEQESSLALAAAVGIGVVEFLLDAIPGMVVRLRTHLLAPEYWGALHRPWGPSPLTDQQHAGAVLWFVAEFADLPFLVILTRRWLRADAREATRMDAELDRREQPEATATGPGGLGAPRPASRPELLLPWWETDHTRLAGHRLARQYGGQRDKDAGPTG